MLKEVLKYIKTNNMFKKNDNVLVAFSGGPDSLSLLHVLNSLKDELNIQLAAAHVNHCLRGNEADSDEEFCRNFCDHLGIKIYVKKAKVYDIAKDKDISVEQAGRIVRYNFFEEIMKKENFNKIAVAHNANDQAETVLMRIMRGTGLDGLCGIMPVRDNIYVRPLLNTRREEIEEYCRQNNLKPRIDKTNFEKIYTRNKIRLELIPYIKKNFNEDIVGALGRLANLAQKDTQYLENEANKKYNIYYNKKHNKVIISKEAFNENLSIVERIMRKAIEELKGSKCNIENKHIYEILELQRNATGKMISLPDNIKVFNNYGDIWITFEDSKAKDLLNLKYEIKLNSRNYIKDLGINIITKIVPFSKNIDVRDKRYTKYFNYDNIQGKDIILRFKKNGDRMRPLGMEGTKKLKDIFIDLKIPKDERGKIPLICFNDDIAWIIGYKLSNDFKVRNNIKNVLEINVKEDD